MSTDRVPDMVGKTRGAHTMPEMSVIGYLIAALLLPVLLPLLPFVALYVAYVRLSEAITG